MRHFTLLALVAALGLASVGPAKAEAPRFHLIDTQSFSLISSAQAEEPGIAVTPAASPRPLPESNSDAFKALAELWQAVRSGNWGLAVALGLMLLVYGSRMFLLPKLNPQAVPLVVAVLGVIGGVASGIAGGAPILSSILGGLFVGAAASGLWEQIFKHVLPQPQKPAAPESGSAPQA